MYHQNCKNFATGRSSSRFNFVWTKSLLARTNLRRYYARYGDSHRQSATTPYLLVLIF